MRTRTIIAIALVAALALPLGGCAQVKAAFTPPEPGTVTKSATVAAVGAPVSGTLVKGFPSVPLWPNSFVDKTRKIEAPSGTAWRGVFISADQYDTVAKGVTVGFQRDGWQVAQVSAATTETPSDIFAANKGSSDVIITLTKQTTPKPATRIEYVITVR